MHPSPLEWLASQGAQRDVLEGLAPVAGDWKTLWTSSNRGDWLLGIAAKLGVAHPLLVRAASGSARLALDLLDGELRDASLRVLDGAQVWASTGAGAKDVAARGIELEAAMARAQDPATDAAARAALAVGLGVADPLVLASAPAAAAEAMILSTMDRGLPAAIRSAHGQCAAAVRLAIPWDHVDAIVRAR